MKKDKLWLPVSVSLYLALSATTAPAGEAMLMGDAANGKTLHNAKCTGCHDSKTSRIEQFTTNKAGKPGFALTLTIRPAECAKTGLCRISAICGPQHIIAFRKSHLKSSFLFYLKRSKKGVNQIKKDAFVLPLKDSPHVIGRRFIYN